VSNPKDRPPQTEESQSEESPNTETTPIASAQGPSLEEQLLYLRAEFENFKKRIEREKDQSVRYANERLAGELLGVVDLFDRAMAFTPALIKIQDKPVIDFIHGIELTQKELTNTLTRVGVELIGKRGEVFHPERHEAISQMEVEPEKVGQVIEIVQQGGLLNGRLIKPAQVVVGVSKEQA